jgi:hypothetical protein
MRNIRARSVSQTWIVAAGLASAIVLAPAAVRAQDVTLHETTTVRGQETPTTAFLGKTAMRHNGADGKDVILRYDAQKMILVDNKRKTYSEMTFDDLQKMAAAATQGMENLPPEVAAKMKGMMGGGGAVLVTKLGAGETIAGYATEKYHVVMEPMEIDLWVAPDLAVPPVYYDAMKSLMPANPMFDMKRLYEEYKKINGTPMKSITNVKMMGQAITTTVVVTAVDKAPIPASTFEVPAGYKLVPMK